MVVITKNELMRLGYGKYQSEGIIRQAKAIMVSKGYTYYENKRLGLVPVESVEEVLGMKIEGAEDLQNHG
ncbi:DUF3173 domain-containing protein [Enterococcus faecium]|uniref:DUF3173 domain-containing protein n=1 Tax=Enterococcus TaxID=1350 RepID=UPI000E03018F|nr:MULTISPECIES: DUF3173 domain-containing protein [Enterococcus]ROX63910.1 DUF3173 domain-containing protein [Enterococcus faecium]ROX65842.1 DUF3173 domain-containing protein [Enterococcus faecium]ROY25588.1 DUF3173 domain-containing protein [Enterococcus faecium]ROY60362.1 DUF3173 domain-containing protein [Enterococcus faecium]ROY76931.1 DUF3173 domain-containing protein [Enterococcus faecium]